ncbi:hypothetical protein G647_05178 [Cladophialophora carrionii CBS 160.54]|uniref:Uncharacterized protein n=1 Tax=Cladophialophora carrionii CBS 160.54 TaxID=1279043 RepID=V9DBQ4_9EURO|nr:uncharacterized protein G647_05178 [Cladophialophora carrionii CBS 160.54]ETI23377.1 hypothetical protein G647_05178 [Cladophialophora carrionii CBS 160.54]
MCTICWPPTTLTSTHCSPSDKHVELCMIFSRRGSSTEYGQTSSKTV